MLFERAAGILLHPTSLPGPFGIGDLGAQAYRWVDFLAGAACKLWQILPIGPTGYGDSPYQSFSAFAGNPYLISPDFLLRDGLLEAGDLEDKPEFPPGRVDYGLFIPWKLDLLTKAFLRFSTDPGLVRTEFESFCAGQAGWLEDYALFMALKEANGGGSWDDWPVALRRREPSALDAARQQFSASVERYKFYQFLFFRQWMTLLEYAHQKEVHVIGDIPIFVAYDSADVWSHPELFFLDDDNRPTVVAGVPPDYFSPTGQLWGNPLYRWEAHKQNGYKWWLERVRAVLKLVDIVRIDHFRGFAGYWEIPAGNPTAEVGRWVTGPGEDFFAAVKAALVDLPIIAEDLGVITPDVDKLRRQFELPGMKILQFAFTGPDNPFLPHNYPRNCVVYTGTHDNDTTRGWFESASATEKDFARQYLGCQPAQSPDPGLDFAWSLIRAAWASIAVFALAPMQDFLGLGTEARMNYPSRLGGNWEWRLGENALDGGLQERIKELNWLYQR